MKITNPIDERLWKALNHVCGYAEHQSDCMTDADWKYAKGLKESIALVSEYASCLVLMEESLKGEKNLQLGTQKPFSMTIMSCRNTILRTRHLPSKKMQMPRNSWRN